MMIVSVVHDAAAGDNDIVNAYAETHDLNSC